MKKSILIFSLLLIQPIISFCQDDNTHIEIEVPKKVDVNKLRFGAYIAPSICWMKPVTNSSGDGLYSVSSDGSKTGYAWGLMVDYFFTPNYGLATGLQINNTGGNIKSSFKQSIVPNNTVKTADFKYYLEYVELPIQLKLRSDELGTSGMKLFGQLGFTPSVNIGKKATYTVVYNDNNGNEQSINGNKEKISGSFSIAPVLLQLNIGGGIEKPIAKRMSVLLGLYFNNGFSPDVTNPDKYSFAYEGKFSDGKIRLNSLSFRAGLFF